MIVAAFDKLPVAKPGDAVLEIESVCGASAVTSARACSPLKLLTPRARGRSVWACTSSFGGGLVAGDQTRLDLRLGRSARCFLGTQASTKIYRNPLKRPCGHVTQAVLAEDSLLVFAPDPVQAFAGSSYTQRQEFQLAEGAALVLLDWFTSGRAARGERWEFSRLQSRNDVFRAGARIFLDSILFDATDGPLTTSMRAGRFNCFALLLLMGDLLGPSIAALLESVSALPVTRHAPLVASASPIPGGAVLRIAGAAAETVGREVHRHLGLLGELLGDDPWARKW